MKNKTVKALALAMAVATVTMMGSASIYAFTIMRTALIPESRK